MLVSAMCPMADPEEVQRVRCNHPPHASLWNILWNWNNVVSVRPKYFIFIGYLRIMRSNQQSEQPHLYAYEPPFLKFWIRPWYPVSFSEVCQCWISCPYTLLDCLINFCFVKSNVLANLLEWFLCNPFQPCDTLIGHFQEMHVIIDVLAAIVTSCQDQLCL